MTDHPHEPSSETPSDKPPLTETIRAKLDEYEVERHLGELASTLEDTVRQGVARVGELAHEHRDDIEYSAFAKHGFSFLVRCVGDVALV